MAKFILEQTCYACPEQYNAYFNNEYVGYLRLRHGYFTVQDSLGKTVFEVSPEGDGIFDVDEKEMYLTKACEALLKSIIDVEEPLYEIVYK